MDEGRLFTKKGERKSKVGILAGKLVVEGDAPCIISRKGQVVDGDAGKGGSLREGGITGRYKTQGMGRGKRTGHPRTSKKGRNRIKNLTSQ